MCYNYVLITAIPAFTSYYRSTHFLFDFYIDFLHYMHITTHLYDAILVF